ncbi:hypothetical protein KR009_002634, partial [Drosophila setifemur]
RRRSGPSTGSHVASVPWRRRCPPRPASTAWAMRSPWPTAVSYLRCSTLE